MAEFKRTLASFAAALLLAGAAFAPAAADELVLGLKGRITALDPHFDNLAANNALSRHIFDSLVHLDAEQGLVPGLAISWNPVGRNGWEFHLRPGVRFHDGTLFTADDVIYTLNRIPALPNVAAGYGRLLDGISTVEKLDSHTVLLRTEGPRPMLPHRLTRARIVSLRAADGMTTAQLHEGQGLIGTGPYRFVSWVPGRQVVLERFDGYWGEQPAWERVVVHSIPSDKARIAALRTGDARLIDAVPPSQVAALRKAKGTSMTRHLSNRVILLLMDQARDDSPFIGGTRRTNPLKEPRVRAAISLAIDREAIATRLLAGGGVPAGQLMAAGSFGHAPDLAAPARDHRQAKRLLAQAGYPRGFRLTLHAPSNGFFADERIAEAVAGGLKEIGIAVEVETMPRHIFFPLAARQSFSALLTGWSNGDEPPAMRLSDLLATYDRAHGLGRENHGRYSNDRVDFLLRQAEAARDDGRRQQLLREAAELVVAEDGVIPLYFEVNTWAMANGLALRPRRDGATLAMDVFPRIEKQ